MKTQCLTKKWVNTEGVLGRISPRTPQVPPIRRSGRSMCRSIWGDTPQPPRVEAGTSRGFTLLETVLAVALAALVFYLISTAIDLHLRVLDQKRQDVEEAQLARKLLQLISNDIRNVVYADSSSSSSFSAQDSGGESSGLDSSGGTGSSSSQSSTSNSSTSSSAGDDDILSTFPTEAGIYGSKYEILLDVARLPRADQYQVYVDPEESKLLIDMSSDVKSVAYYLGTPDIDAENNEAQFGLMRRVLDRAVTKWAAESGNTAGLNDNAELIAPEVTAMEFRYSDGYEWVEEWDSSLYGLPLAVEVTVEITTLTYDGAATGSAATETQTGYGQYLAGDHVYRILVPIPTAEPATLDTGTSEL